MLWPNTEPVARESCEHKYDWSADGQRMVPTYVIRNVRQNQYGETVGQCGVVPVGFTFSTRLWFWADRAFGGYIPRTQIVN